MHLIIALFGLPLIFSAFAQDETDYISYVDPFIGTAPSTTPSALRHSEGATEGYAQTMPAVTAPFGMTNWTPQTRATEEKCLSPYYYTDNRLQGFRASHWMSGSCTQDYGSFTFMPMTGRLRGLPDSRASAFRHETEVSTPAYYRVLLDDYGIEVEMTGTARAALLRLTFQRADSAYLLLQPNSDEGEGSLTIDPASGHILASNPVHRIYQGWGEPAGFSGHLVMASRRPWTQQGILLGDAPQDGQLQARDRADLAAYGALYMEAGDTLLIKMGTSFTSTEQAAKNMEAELPHWDFDRARRELEAEWNAMLGRAHVEGGTEAQRTTFYTALYHSLFLPRRFNDVDGTYVGFAGDDTQYVVEDGDYYVDFSMWDTYRAIHPLYNLLYPEKSRDMMRSLVAKAEQGGWLPIFPAWNQYTAAMIGDHVIATLGDAYVKGVRDWNPERAYPLLRRNAFTSPASYAEYRDGKGRRALDSYLQYGYVPLEDTVGEAFHKREQVSRTLEYAYDDFVLSRLARALGKTRDAELLAERARNYRHVFHPEHGYVCGRYADGRWTEQFERSKRMPYITEGTPQHYTWYVPHDPGGLMQLMGGAETFLAKLDSLFDGDYYWHGNEPCHQVAYLYPYAGAPHKTQARVRQIMADEYGTGPGGLSGNDDAGQMSAWYVFSAMGFYPVCPGVPEYVLGSPLFDRIRLQQPGGKAFELQAAANAPDHPYIQQASIDGQPYGQTALPHERIRAGGTLRLIMGPEPSAWGQEHAPYSLSAER